jgi:hypothetical protein
VCGLFLPGGGYGTGGKAVLRHRNGVVRQADEVFIFVDWGDDVTARSRPRRLIHSGMRYLDNDDSIL